jgi:RHS repeat-associated protein
MMGDYVGGLGHESEGNTGLIYMRARYMDPVLGRFISEDPAGDGNNWFVYCGDNPANSTDASGHKNWSGVAGADIMTIIAMGFAYLAAYLQNLPCESIAIKVGAMALNVSFAAFCLILSVMCFMCALDQSFNLYNFFHDACIDGVSDLIGCALNLGKSSKTSAALRVLDEDIIKGLTQDVELAERANLILGGSSRMMFTAVFGQLAADTAALFLINN